MSDLKTELNEILDNVQSFTEDQVTKYFEGEGWTSLTEWLKQEARMGYTKAVLHIEQGVNPKKRRQGWATLAGELARLYQSPSRSIEIINDIGWIYLDAKKLKHTQFQQQVMGFVAHMVSEGLAVSTTMGATMADLVISWDD